MQQFAVKVANKQGDVSSGNAILFVSCRHTVSCRAFHTFAERRFQWLQVAPYGAARCSRRRCKQCPAHRASVAHTDARECMHRYRIDSINNTIQEAMPPICTYALSSRFSVPRSIPRYRESNLTIIINRLCNLPLKTCPRPRGNFIDHLR